MKEPLSVSIGQENIVELKISGSLSLDRLPALRADIEKAELVIREMHDRTGRKVRVLIDITEFDGVYDVGAITAMTEFAKADERFVQRTASFGGPDNAKISGEVVTGLAGRNNIKVFASKADALDWLTKS